MIQVYDSYHSMLSGIWLELKKNSMWPSRGERACILKSFRIYFFEILDWGHKSGQLGSLAESAQSRPIHLGCLAGRFYGLWIRISDISIFWNCDACSFTMRRSRKKFYQSYSHPTQHAVMCFHRNHKNINE